MIYIAKTIFHIALSKKKIEWAEPHIQTVQSLI